MGKIKLAETRASVIQKLGTPTNSFMWETAPLRQDTWTNKKTKSRLVVLYAAKMGRVVQIETTSPKFTTPSGLSVKSTASDFYNWATNSTRTIYLKTNGVSNPDYFLLAFDSRGMGFLMKQSAKPSSEWKTEKILVFIPQSVTCLYSTKAYTRVSRKEFLDRFKQIQRDQ